MLFIAEYNFIIQKFSYYFACQTLFVIRLMAEGGKYFLSKCPSFIKWLSHWLDYLSIMSDFYLQNKVFPTFKFIFLPSVINISIFEINMKINCNKNIETVLYCHHLFYFIVYSYFKGDCIQGTLGKSYVI